MIKYFKKYLTNVYNIYLLKIIFNNRVYEYIFKFCAFLSIYNIKKNTLKHLSITSSANPTASNICAPL